MNNKFKRALSSILAFVMVISVLTVMNVSSVFASTAFDNADTTTLTGNPDSSSVPTSNSSLTVTKGTDYVQYTYDIAGTAYANQSNFIGLSLDRVYDSSDSAGKLGDDASYIRFTTDGEFDLSITATSSGKASNFTLVQGETVSNSTDNKIDSSATSSGSTASKTGCSKGTWTIGRASSVYVSTLTIKVYYSTDPSLELSAETLSLKQGESGTITATEENLNDYTVTWAIGNTTLTDSVASEISGVTYTLSGSELSIAAASDATADDYTLTVTATKGESTITKTATITIVGYVSVDSVTLDSTTLSVSVGKSAVLTATVSPEDATDPDVTWESDKESIAIVDGGTVFGVSEGTATIKATAGDQFATCTVTVTAAVSDGGNGFYASDFADCSYYYNETVYDGDYFTASATAKNSLDAESGHLVSSKNSTNPNVTYDGSTLEIRDTLIVTAKQSCKISVIARIGKNDKEVVVYDTSTNAAVAYVKNTNANDNIDYYYLTFDATAGSTYCFGGKGTDSYVYGVVVAPDVVTEGDDTYVIFSVYKDKLDKTSFDIVDTDGAQNKMNTESGTIVYAGIDYDDDDTSEYNPASSDYYVVAYKVSGASGATNVDEKFGIIFND